MKKLYITLLLAAATAPSLLAQGQLDANAMRLLSDYEAATTQASRAEIRALPPKYDLSQKALAIVTLNEGFDTAALDALGIKWQGRRADMVLAWVDAKDILALSKEASIKSISLGNDAKPMLDKAREVTFVDAIQQGTDADLGRAYTGKGVIVGLLDTGLDPNHVNFKDSEGNNRIKLVLETQGDGFASRTYSTPEDIARMRTDDSNETHGTHVLGIMAGSFNDKGQTAIYNKFGRPQKSSTAKNPYYGVATESEIVACAGSLNDANVMFAADEIVKFANAQGKRAVINYSLGSNIGPHDGTSDVNRYLAEVGKEAIICMASGNEGVSPVSLSKTATAGDNTLRFFVSNSGTATDFIDIWAEDATPVKVTFIAYNKATHAVEYSFPVEGPMNETIITGDYYTRPEYIHDDAFNKAFGSKGAVFLSSSVKVNNNRYNCTASLQTQGANSGYYPGFIIEIPVGKKVNVFSQRQTLMSNGVEGFSNGNDEMSVSSMSCGENILCVGSFNSRTRWPVIYNGSASEYHYNADPVLYDVSDFSSYGVLASGESLPHILAPGQAIVSSFSKFYIENTPEEVITASATADGRESYWAVAQGTSMATPFTAGVIATWLEANPNIGINDVKEALKATAIKDEYTAVNPAKSGYGKLNALAGLKYILGINSIGNIAIDEVGDNVLVNALGGGAFNVAVPGASGLNVELFNLAGQLVESHASAADDYTFTAQTGHGIYVMKVTTPEGKLSTSKVTID